MKNRRSDAGRSLTTPIGENSRHDEAKEYPIAEDDVVEQLSIGARNRERDRPYRLNDDSNGRGVVPWVQPRDGFEEETIGCHRLEHARRGENAAVHESDRGDDDPEPHE